MAKGKWHKMYSETLSQEIAFDENSGWLFCKDGCRYSPNELAVITNNFKKRDAFPLAVHIVKSAFKGEVVKREVAKPKAEQLKAATPIQTQTVATVATEKQYEFDIY